MRRTLKLASAALAFAACVSSQFAEGQFICDPAGEAACPPGLVCAADGVCRGSAGVPPPGADVFVPDVRGDAPGDARDAESVDADAGPVRVPFNAATLVPSLNTSADDNSPRVLPNGVAVYFQSTRSGGAGQADIYIARRAVVTDPFGAASPAPGVNTTDNETDPMPSPDELAIYFTSNRPSTMTGVKLWVGTRGAVASSFAGFALVPGVESPMNDGQPFLRADGQELWLTSNRGGASSLIYRAPLVDGGFANPVAVDELNSAATQWKPYLTNDGLTAFWSSTRSDGGAKGGHDLWTATRASLTAPFSAPQNVAELNTPYNEQMGSVSPDGSHIYFSSDRPGGAGSYDVYEATR